MKFKSTLLFLFITLNMIVFVVTDMNKKQRIDVALKSSLNELQKDYKTIQYQQKIIVQNTMEFIENTQIELLGKLASSNKAEKKDLRKKLYERLYLKYTQLSRNGVYQFQFTLSNNKTFLRMHKPEKYGDDLSGIRYSIEYVNKNKKPVNGFEGGKTTHAIRYVRPLFDHSGNYLCAVEISFSSDYIQNYLTNISSLHSHFLIKKNIFAKKVWERKEIRNEYIEAAENEHFMLKLTTQHKKEVCVTDNKKKLQNKKEEILQKMERGKAFSIFVEHNGKEHYGIEIPYKYHADVVSFIPVQDTHGNVSSWIVSYTTDDFITMTLSSVRIVRIVMFFVLLAFIYFVYKIFTQKQDLEWQVDEKTKELKIKSRELETYFDSMSDGLSIIDLESKKFVNINKAFEKLTGYTKEELLSFTLDQIYPKQAVDFVEEQYDPLKKADSELVSELPILHKNGTLKLYDVAAKSYKINNKIYNIGVFRDVTQRIKLEGENKKKARKLEESEMFLRSIMENALDGIITINERGIIQTFNKAAEGLFGYTKEEMIGKSINIIIPEPYGSSHDQYIKNYLTTGDVKVIGKTLEQETVKKDGSKIPISIRVSEIELGSRRIFTALIQDISERKANEEELVKAKEKAEEATKAKSYFLANMSHEIRTPMNGIIGMSHLVAKTNLDQQQKHYIDRINDSANLLLGIINDILDISKIEAGKLEIEKNTFDLFSIIESVVNLVEVKAYDKDLDLIIDYDLNLGKRYYGDSLRITQILTNLLSNAVKFTHVGGIILKIAKGEDIDFVRFEVSDTGIGLSKEQIDKVFDSFTQADSTTTKKYGGTGLGLTITKKLIELMNGKIWIESEIGVGSKFLFEIELQKEETDKAYTIFSGKKALIIDDNPIWLDIISYKLKYFGLDVDCAQSGQEGIEILKNKKSFYDLIFIDWNMPEPNGIETARIIHDELGIDSQKIILSSAHYKNILNKDIEKTHKISRFLHKPINPSLLNNLLCEIFLGSISDESREKINSQKGLSNKIKTLKGSRILLAEDNEVNQEIIIMLLEGSGIEIDIASNGFETIKKADDNDYELILMDIQMPIMDGYEATKTIRETDKDIPIVALTANAMKEDIEKTKAAGMNKHLNKPIEVDKLFETLLEFIPPKVKIDEKSFEMEEEKEKETDELPEFETLDKEYALNLVMGKKNAFIQSLKGLLNYKDTNFNQLGDEEFKRVFHTIKGLSASAGALELRDMAKEIEESLDKGLLGGFIARFNKTIEEIETKLSLNEADNEKIELSKELRDELFGELKEAVSTKRAKNCKPVIARLEKYKLNEEDKKLFKEIKTLTSKFKFKQALEIF